VELVSEVLGRISATADDAGDVLFPALLPGQYTPHLTCGDHALDEEAPPFDVGEAALAARFVVHEQLAITGIVVGAEGASDDGRVSVGARLLGTEPGLMGPATVSREDGHFALRGLEAGTYEVSATDAVGGPLSLRPAVVTVAEGAPAPEVRLVAGARFRLEGHVIDEQGRPLALAQLNAHQQSAANGWMWGLDEDGRFELDGLRAGKVHAARPRRPTTSPPAPSSPSSSARRRRSVAPCAARREPSG
jgi:hypothetical protein